MAAFVLADSFLPATSRFSASEKARVLDFVGQFQKNPANPGVSLERIRKARSENVWSGRISRDIRAILYKDGDTWVALHAGHHDPAYRWAERRDIGRHPVTGALQVVEVVEDVRQVLPEATVEGLLAAHSDEYLTSLGVPESWLPLLRQVGDEGQLLEVCVRLPSEVGERVLRVADGEVVTPPMPVPIDRPLIETPEIGHRFYVVDDRSDLQSVLNAPLASWIAFLHPSQRKLVAGSYNGPVKVTGSAGTGKTTVALHRARHLARQGKKVLVTTFVTTLAANLQRHLQLFCSPEELERITVSTVHGRALAVARSVDSRVAPANQDEIKKLLDTMRLRFAPQFDPSFVRAEWEAVVQLQGIDSWSVYRTARRSGRGRPLSVADRKAVWQVFERVLSDLHGRRHYDWPGLCKYAESLLQSSDATSDFDAVLVDEVQDLKPPEIRFLRELVAHETGNLMLFGDEGQKIYPGGFSLTALGIETRGRSHILRLNYRTTEQIRQAADQVLGSTAGDLDGATQSRAGTHSLLRGPKPMLKGYESAETETDEAARRVRRWLDEGLHPEAIGIFARTTRRAEQLADGIRGAKIPVHLLSESEERAVDAVQIGTMHRAKGLEFKAVLICDCSLNAVPNKRALSAHQDPQDREDAEARERRLLYVAMTRARDELAISWIGTPSPFLSSLLATKTKDSES